ncbi:alanine/glycine:cation symporter family protein [Sphingobium aquiterrae]|uniref:alanine/glycine:cation symporter family protein n=1 Tax=Sphingobium aquiterrae TaxID=2038656 RepID=UPI003017E5BF
MLDIIPAAAHALSSLVFAEIEIFQVRFPLIVIWLASAMLFFTIRLKCINIRGFAFAVGILLGRHREKDAPGEMSHFQALSTALSGTLGLGNIAGVAIGIAMGGPGAVFWMIVGGLFAMSLKFAEVLLAVKYRTILSNGRYSGGPMWMLRNGLAARGMPRLGKILGMIYAIFALFAFIQVVQVNQSYSQIRIVLGLGGGMEPALIYGLVIAGATAIVLIGGVAVLARVTSRLVPVMCAFYMLGIAIILVLHADKIPSTLLLIVTEAFAPTAVAGGFLATMVVGLRRAAFSNEAGIGPAAIAHAVAKTREPASEGFVALLEPFLDTVVICTATALAILVTGSWRLGYNDIAMTSAAFETAGSWFPALLAIAVCLFAFSTILAVGYYGLQVWAYLVGPSKWKDRAYLIFFCATLPIGALVDVSTVTNLADSFFFLLAVPNIIGLYILSGEVRDDGERYFAARRDIGRVDTTGPAALPAWPRRASD